MLYRHNYHIYSINLAFEKHYAKNGDFNNYWKYAQRLFDMDDVFMGRDCLQHIVNVRRALNIVLSHLCRLSLTQRNDISQK